MSKNAKKGKIVACLDMGSSKLVCLIASITNDDVQILGYGHKESRGISASAISDMRLAQKSITNVVSEAERMAGFNIDRLLIGISGSQVISTRKEVSTKIASDIVKASDIAVLAAKVRAEFKKNNREIIHLVPLQYRIDDSAPVVNPRYMSGETLYAKFHVVSTSQTTIKNIENCLKRCQLSVNNYVVEPYVSGLSCLSDNEMDLGSLLIDIGGSSTSFSIILEGKLIHVGHSPIGGVHITKDISTILNISFDAAEKIKNLNGSLLISPIEERELIKMKFIDADTQEMIQITRAELRDIIQSRLEEMFESVKTILEKSGISVYKLGNIVLTGGVTSIVGIDKLASEIFEKNVRIGYPNKLESVASELLNPTHSCSLGMLVFLHNLHLKEKIKDGFETKNSWFARLIEKLAAV
ncbi:MAG: cell division protein FtsA [Rickettsiales bacterium]|nr:cell division protein FtsA [Rickettsiales bacterium]